MSDYISRACHNEIGAPANWIMAYARPDTPRRSSQLGIWTGDQTLQFNIVTLIPKNNMWDKSF